jgi:hypothetical protein
LITGITNGAATNSFGVSNFAIGFTWLNGSVTPTITHLSRWKIAGNTQVHNVYLATSSPFVILGTVSVDMSTGSAGSWVSTALGSPVTLVALTQYALMSAEVNGGDQWYDDTTTIGGADSSVSAISGSCFSVDDPPTAEFLHANGSFTYVPVNAVITP